MSLIYKVGDLILAAKNGEVDAIGHGCNCFCTMGSGIAPLVKNAFPLAYEADLETIKGDEGKLGEYSFADYFFKGKKLTIFNIYSQYGYWGRKKGIMDFNYNAFEHATWQVVNHMLAQDIKTLGLPLIGAGLAGGDWGIIEEIIQRNLAAHVDIIIYVLNETDIPSWRQ